MVWLFKRRPLVSICVPAYYSQAFIASVLDSALAQTVTDIEIIVSNDGGIATPDLEPYRMHPNIRVIDQRRRLGWVDNTNFVLSKARGQYFMVLPHDDFLAPAYVEECLVCLEREPKAFAAYSDIEYPDGIMEASDVRGGLNDRVRYMMQNLYNGYSYRALMRRRFADWSGLKLRHNPPTDFCVDTTWILQQALLGELRRVPKPLYRKGYHEHNTHTKWQRIPKEDLIAAWLQHCDTLGALARKRVRNRAFIAELVEHRRDPCRVRETPPYLRAAFRK
ncbi:glycosyltransferase family 2 protein [uncultured Cohaesibacter sp.]|uniref:glycosyltransferase family 2 protein n=1 Tax=uncultured Cohaesibacter sp. TaxID=1002546 RepID=UPI0029C9117A|nr:glycosyltransferase family 2 protein [uncultured Cohaesibacter sp.]